MLPFNTLRSQLIKVPCVDEVSPMDNTIHAAGGVSGRSICHKRRKNNRTILQRSSPHRCHICLFVNNLYKQFIYFDFFGDPAFRIGKNILIFVFLRKQQFFIDVFSYR